MMTDNKNLILAIALSILIVLGFEFFFNQPRVEQQRAQQAERAAAGRTTTEVIPAAPGTVAAPGSTAAAPAVAPDAAALIASQPRVRIESPVLQGSILLRGGRIDDLKLISYRQTVDRNSPPITLLAPGGTANAYFAEFGWGASEGMPVPGPETAWTADRQTLTPGQPVTLTWDNGQGLRFERRISLDNAYMFEVRDRVVNSADGTPVRIYPYARIFRSGTPKTEGFYILHEGPIAVMDGVLQEPDYSDVKDKKALEYSSTGGWLGITDKYWLVALVPDQSAGVKAAFRYVPANGEGYQADFVPSAVGTLQPGAAMESATRLFAGAKEVHLLDRYQDAGIPRFDRAIDFGWFYFLTKPIFLILDYFYRLLGNYGLAILLLTVLVKIVFFPLANKSYRAMSKMKLLQPEMEKLRERYGDDRARMSQEMMALYKRSGANPLAGCLPVVIQIPVFFALYKVLFVSIEMRHAPFFGWIQDLSAPDPTSIFNLFGLLPWGPPEVYLLGSTIGAWPVIMGLTMFLQQKLNPQPPDPIQARVFMAMPFIFTFILAPFAAGLVIYWAWNNALSVLQQWVIMKRVQAKPTK